MRLFVSYARVDQAYCRQIVEMLSLHEVWYDERIFGAQKWWDEIQKRLDWCEGFVYLISSDSLTSEYCRQEFEIALRYASKHFFPVVIQHGAHLNPAFPLELRAYQHIDLSQGLQKPLAIRDLLNAIHAAEIKSSKNALRQRPVEKVQAGTPVFGSPAQVIGAAVDALANEDFDNAVYLLERLHEDEPEESTTSRIVKVLLRDASESLTRKSYLRDAEREYLPIVEVISRELTRELGCREFGEFRRKFPNYDPQNLTQICANAHRLELIPPDLLSLLPAPFAWCEVLPGKVTLHPGTGKMSHLSEYDVSHFFIAKYPVTNAQFQVFVDEADGYANPEWWNYSNEVRSWRIENTEPVDESFRPASFPRTHVTWYESVAFCRWLSFRTGVNITLPTEQQWQRAAQGDDNRIYPWGNEFDKSRCNTHESDIGQPTQVTRYPNGSSPYGVFDMSGNVREFCLNKWETNSTDLAGGDTRVFRGGSWYYKRNEARVIARKGGPPDHIANRWGFRVVFNPS